MRRAFNILCLLVAMMAFLGSAFLVPTTETSSGGILGFTMRDAADPSMGEARAEAMGRTHFLDLPATTENHGAMALVFTETSTPDDWRKKIQAHLRGGPKVQGLSTPDLGLPHSEHTVLMGVAVPPLGQHVKPIDLESMVTRTRASIARLATTLRSSEQEAQEADTVFEVETTFLVTELERKNTVELQSLEAQRHRYTLLRAAEAEAIAQRLIAEGEGALRKAEAVRARLTAEALARPGGQYVGPMEAARRFRLGPVHLDPSNMDFFHHFGSLPTWRAFFGVGD